jgi:hypothetical protein
VVRFFMQAIQVEHQVPSGSIIKKPQVTTHKPSQNDRLHLLAKNRKHDSARRKKFHLGSIVNYNIMKNPSYILSLINKKTNIFSTKQQIQSIKQQ